MIFLVSIRPSCGPLTGGQVTYPLILIVSHADYVLVVGAGPTGLMLANQLARRGVRAMIIDRHAGPSLQTRALAVQARTLEIIRSSASWRERSSSARLAPPPTCGREDGGWRVSPWATSGRI